MNDIAMAIYFVCFLWLLSNIDRHLRDVLNELKKSKKEGNNNNV